MKAARALVVPVALALAALGCGGTLDAGRDVPHGLLPVDERNPVILWNDGAHDNWVGEYAALLANSGGPPLAGIVVGASVFWGSVEHNVAVWTDLIEAARASGLQGIPDPTASAGAPLVPPADGRIESTAPNRSAGAGLIIETSRRLSQPWRPVAVVIGGPLTDLADAYLLDPTVVDRVVVVASLGAGTGSPSAAMVGPNGDLDPWAAWIVAQRFRYVQVSTYYDQTQDVTAANVASLPQNPLGAWMAAKQPNLLTVPTASDQVAILAAGLSTFVTAVERVSPDGAAFSGTAGPTLVPDAEGSAWAVSQIAAPLAGARLWQMLLDPGTFGS